MLFAVEQAIDGWLVICASGGGTRSIACRSRADAEHLAATAGTFFAGLRGGQRPDVWPVHLCDAPEPVARSGVHRVAPLAGDGGENVFGDRASQPR